MCLVSADQQRLQNIHQFTEVFFPAVFRYSVLHTQKTDRGKQQCIQVHITVIANLAPALESMEKVKYPAVALFLAYIP